MHDQRKADLYGLATVCIWSTVASAFKIALRHMDPLQLLSAATVVSIATLAAILALQGRLNTLRDFTGRDLLRCAGLGMLNPFLYYVVLFQAYDLLPAQEAQPLNYTWAITLALLSIPLLRQKVRPRDMAAVLTSYAGVVVISTHGDPLNLHFSNGLGVALALGSTVIWALYWIFNAKQRRDPVAGLLLSFLFGLPAVLAATAAFSSLPVLSAPIAGEGLLAAAYVGLFEMGVTFVLWLTALRLTYSAARIGNLIFLSPFLSLVFIHFLVGEEILPSTFVGLVFIIAGNAIQTFGRKA